MADPRKAMADWFSTSLAKASDGWKSFRFPDQRPFEGRYRVLTTAVFLLLVFISVYIIYNYGNMRIPAIGVKAENLIYEGTKQRFQFLGGNHFNLLPKYIWGEIHGYTGPQVLDISAQYNLTVLRFWASCSDGYWADQCLYAQDGSFNRSGKAFFSGFDRLVADAEKRGIYLIPVLTDAYGTYSSATGDKGAVCQVGSPANLEYMRFVKAVVSRYKDRPIIMAWEIGNEGHDHCPDSKDLVAWYEDSATLIRSIDQKHLISTGENNFGSLDAGPFLAAHSVENVDLASVHIYDRDLYNVEDVSSKGDADKAAAVKGFIDYWASVSHIQLYKPIYVGEFGSYNLTSDAGKSFDTRFLNDAKSSDIDGFIIWSWLEGDDCTSSTQVNPGPCVTPTRTPSIAALIGSMGSDYKATERLVKSQSVAKAFLFVIVPLWLIAIVAIRTRIAHSKKHEAAEGSGKR